MNIISLKKLSELTGVGDQAIRRWTKVGIIQPYNKTKLGHFIYCEKHIDEISNLLEFPENINYQEIEYLPGYRFTDNGEVWSNKYYIWKRIKFYCRDGYYFVNIEIKTLLRDGKTLKFISEKYKVSITMISKIKRGKTWVHIHI